MKFRHKTAVCDRCGAYLRDKGFETAYMKWLEKAYESKREKFQVQCHLSENLNQCLSRLLEEYPGVSSTVLLRGLVAVYLNFVDVNPTLSRSFNHLVDQKVLRSFSEDSRKKKFNIQFKPKMMLDLLAVSGITLMKPCQIVEASIIKMMAAYTSQDEKLREFWEREIKQYVEIVLKAA